MLTHRIWNALPGTRGVSERNFMVAHFASALGVVDDGPVSEFEAVLGNSAGIIGGVHQLVS